VVFYYQGWDFGTGFAGTSKPDFTIINGFGNRGMLIGRVPLKFQRIKNKGSIFTIAPHLMFKDDSIFEFAMELSILSNTVTMDAYKYQYTRLGGYFFRYEKEATEDIIWKPPEHLHVLLDAPHFNAPLMTLEQVLHFIEVNFYQVGKREKIVGRKIEVII